MTIDSAALPSLVLYGFVLGWSVAWPPGPINAEIVRRGLSRGFWAGYGLCLGACFGDALWAVLVAVGAGTLLAAPSMHRILDILSTALLIILAGLFLRGAWRGLIDWREGKQSTSPVRFESTRAGFALGFTMALTGPWNLAFWLAVLGRSETLQLGIAASLVVAASVIAGAASWGVLLSGAVVGLRMRFASAAWEVFARGATGLLMLYFAVRSLWQLAHP